MWFFAIAKRSNTHRDQEFPSVFARLLQLSDREVMWVLVFVMGETLQSGTALIEALGHVLKMDMARQAGHQ